jgi:hypothetical protein
MKKVVKRFLKKVHNPLYEFGFQVTHISKRRYTVPANIFIDDNGTWINLGDKKIILFRPNNGDEAYLDDVIPMTIEDEPQILGNAKIDLTSSEIQQIKDFVVKYKKQLLQLPERKVDLVEFFEVFKEIEREPVKNH